MRLRNNIYWRVTCSMKKFICILLDVSWAIINVVAIDPRRARSSVGVCVSVVVHVLRPAPFCVGACFLSCDSLVCHCVCFKRILRRNLLTSVCVCPPALLAGLQTAASWSAGVAAAIRFVDVCSWCLRDWRFSDGAFRRSDQCVYNCVTVINSMSVRPKRTDTMTMTSGEWKLIEENI